MIISKTSLELVQNNTANINLGITSGYTVMQIKKIMLSEGISIYYAHSFAIPVLNGQMEKIIHLKKKPP